MGRRAYTHGCESIGRRWTVLDRVKAIDGRLMITSKPGLGASLEMVGPLPARQGSIA